MNFSGHFFKLTLIAMIALFVFSCEQSADLTEGRRVFEQRCALCHGLSGVGNGDLAAALATPPANLTTSTLSDTDKEAIIRGGGASVGRSSSMPPWNEALSDREIRNVIQYINTLKQP